MAVDVTTGSQFEAKIPHELFEIPVSGMTDVRTHYAVAHDGQRFLVNKVLDRGNAPLTVVVDWQAQLKK